MELFKKLFYLIFIGFVLFFFVWALYLPKKDVTRQIGRIIKEQKGKQDVVFEGVVFQEAYGGQKYWEIKARSSSINNDNGLATLETTTGVFYENNRPVLNFIAPSVQWKMNKKEIVLIDPLGFDASLEKDIKKLVADQKEQYFLKLPETYQGKGKGYFFRAKKLYWQLSDRKISCPEGIWLYKGNVAGYGGNFEADAALEKVFLSGNPRIVINNGSPAVLTAPRFIADNPKNQIYASDGVIMISEGIKISAREAVYSQKNDRLDLSGGVIANYQNIKAEAQKAYYNIAGSRVVLHGSARLTREGSVLQGEKVIISLKDKKFNVSGKTTIVIPEKEMKK